MEKYIIKRKEEETKEPQVVFKFRKGYAWNANPQVIGEELESIREENGIINPHDVVRVAEDPNNPLHPCFDWDNEIAGEKWRLHSARRLINSIVVVCKKTEIETKQYFHVTVKKEEAKEQGYVDIADAKSEEFKKATIRSAKLYLENFVKKYEVFDYMEIEIGLVKRIIDRMDNTDEE